jgi:hypothetical protein
LTSLRREAAGAERSNGSVLLPFCVIFSSNPDAGWDNGLLAVGKGDLEVTG